MDDDAFARLEAYYCPPLDPALLSAIVSDYDLSNAQDVLNARETLDPLKESALLEEAAGFDPSGTGAQEDASSPEKRAESCPETSTSRTRETDLTSLSNGISSLDLEDMVGEEGGSIGNPEDLENLDDDTKIRLLQDLFGDRVTRYSIQHTLRKCNGRWQASMEELLNHVYFEEAEDSDGTGKVATKGIEAFSEDNTIRRGRKGKPKGKKKQRALDSSHAASLPTSPLSMSPAPAVNRWKTASEDIEFVASRSRITAATVSSVYYEKGASVPQTIGALLKASMEETKAIVTDDAAVAASARELGYEFPGISPEYLAAIVRLTHPSTKAAHELAQALAAKPKETNGGGIQLVPQYVPPALDDEVAFETTTKNTRSALPSPAFTEGPSPASRASAYASARATAYSQARNAHRKAKSDRLMGGAAAYYGQVGREYAALSSRATASAADDLADYQSTPTQLDLHGVDVLNAVRIAQEKVGKWWERLGESRVNGRVGAEDRQMGYRIVVGRGTHSEGGKGKLGPAVGKVLREGGWRVENAGAVIVVKGRARR